MTYMAGKEGQPHQIRPAASQDYITAKLAKNGITADLRKEEIGQAEIAAFNLGVETLQTYGKIVKSQKSPYVSIGSETTTDEYQTPTVEIDGTPYYLKGVITADKYDDPEVEPRLREARFRVLSPRSEEPHNDGNLEVFSFSRKWQEGHMTTFSPVLVKTEEAAIHANNLIGQIKSALEKRAKTIPTEA